MRRYKFYAVALGMVLLVLGIGSYAVAGGGNNDFRGSPLNGYEENPDVSTVASGSFEARLSGDGKSLHYKLSYSGLEGAVTASHVHFGKPAVNGGVSYFLCNGPSTPACPAAGTVEGDIDAADVIGPTGQGIEVGNFAEILAAMRAGHTYANVHSTKWPGGEIRAQIDSRRGHQDDGGRGHDGDD
jgi:hypothetical protein